MNVVIEFQEPVVTYSAIQLAAMPLSDMQMHLEAQEKHFQHEKGVGREAWEIIEALRQGGVRLERDTEKKRNAYRLGDQAAPVYVLRQLAKRGYINAPELIPGNS